MNQLVIEERQENGMAVLSVSGPVNSYTFTEFQERIDKAVLTTDVAVDMEKVTSLSSSGMGALMAALEDAQTGRRRLLILRPSEAVRLAIEATGFVDLFPVVQSLNESEP